MSWQPVDLGDPELNRAANMLSALADESDPCWWWLSFTDSERPKGEQFLGVAIVEANNYVTAGMEAHRLGCNPGGAIAITAIPDEHVPGASLRGRLLSRVELEANGLV